ncbi:hypothetical protein GCM10010123_20320 [Pilimelia anulata]|uniref:Uncharacterized protein n=1 Tax=Pilimelia anulata TaxID=53371 RepID=A0A8J3B520_9ACTN|nr:hypothetical protein [Pilimelia anulata]GGJ90408.1 hypothetical protein GCM10010123_20320 [Pilimelia anulata]
MRTKAEREAVRRQLAAGGYSPGEIARVFEAKAKARTRLALRWACGMTLQDVANVWNRLDSSGRAPMTAQRVSDFERWPEGGRRPTVYALGMLARVYEVSLDRLLDAADYEALDDKQLFEMVQVCGASTSAVGSDSIDIPGVFDEFVGREIAQKSVTLVYPVFRLSSEARAAIAGLNQQLLYEKEESPFTRMHRIDVPVAAAVNDMRALVYATELFQRHPRVSWTLQTDTDAVRDPARSIISFGLSSNDCTHMYLETVERPLFRIVPDGRGSEYLVLADGFECRSTPDAQYGIVLRARPFPDLPDRVWFVCAGLGPLGTPGAAWYLSTSWRDLHREAGTADFVAVVKVRTYSERSAQLEHLLLDGRNGRGV